MPTFVRKLSSILCAATCASLFTGYIFLVYPTSGSSWYYGDAVFLALYLFAPLTTLFWASMSQRLREKAYPYIWLSILLYPLLALVIFPAIFSNIATIFLGVAFGIINGFILLLSPPPKAGAPELDLHRKAVLLLAGGALIGIPVWSFASIGIVALSAETAAEGRSYCLQTAHSSGAYIPIQSLWEMSGLKMRSSVPDYGHFHAILIIQGDDGPILKNWSYLHQSFMDRDDQAAGPACKPRPHYVRELSFD